MKTFVAVIVMVIAANAAQAQQKGRVPCSFNTNGLQYECVEDNGKMRQAGPAWPRQEKHFNDCVAQGRRAGTCYDEAAKVK